MANSTEHFDALAAALYGGPVKAADLKIMPGEKSADRETRSAALLASMIRLGIVRDGQLVSLDSN